MSIWKIVVAFQSIECFDRFIHVKTTNAELIGWNFGPFLMEKHRNMSIELFGVSFFQIQTRQYSMEYCRTNRRSGVQQRFQVFLLCHVVVYWIAIAKPRIIFRERSLFWDFFIYIWFANAWMDGRFDNAFWISMEIQFPGGRIPGGNWIIKNLVFKLSREWISNTRPET